MKKEKKEKVGKRELPVTFMPAYFRISSRPFDNNRVVRMKMGWINGSMGDTSRRSKSDWRDIPLREENQGFLSKGWESREGEIVLCPQVRYDR